MAYKAPVADIVFTLHNIADLNGLLSSGGFDGVASDMVSSILAEAARFAETELDSINVAGDRFGCVLANDVVKVAPGWKETYRRWRGGGWNGISAPTTWGGQDLPILLGAAVAELWNGGSPAFALGPMLTASAIEALQAHASDKLKARFLPHLTSGAWMATMNLTEPQAGSDLGALTARAERAVDGTYRIFGQKIFISYGEHDLTENIIHLVLARLPDAPAGSAGISMFLVPKYLTGDDGSIGERNDVKCLGIERKLGFHGSPTCTMAFGDDGSGAIGWLVGQENRGLAAMFTMMNVARLTVGIQAVGVAARACNRAIAYAGNRRQGRAAGAAADTTSRIVEHPDVQRNLLTMTALTAAGRAIAYTCAHAIDLSRRGPDQERGAWAQRASLLTPVAKAFASDAVITVTSLGVQVHGGAGYIEETGAAQDLRDGRIFAIYEGTNGIQAIDLVTRKLPLAGGEAAKRMIDEMSQIAGEAATLNRDEFGQTGARLLDATERLSKATGHILAAIAGDRRSEALASATPYLRLFGLTCGGTLLAKGALQAVSSGDSKRWVALARFFAENLIDETAGLLSNIVDGAAALDATAQAYLPEIHSQT